MPESKLTSFEAVIAAFAFVATFALGYEYWRLSVRQDQQDARIERQREDFEKSLFELQRASEEKRAADEFELQTISLAAPHLSKLRDVGRDATTSQRIVVAAAELLASRGRPAFSQMVEKIREQSPPAARAEAVPAAVATSPSSGWLVLLATLPGNDRKVAEALANEKLSAAKDLGMTPLVTVYKTKLKGRYVVALGKPTDRSAALAAAAQARSENLSADAYPELDDGWELTGTAPFATEVRSASIP
jgi:hypothetical protein